MRRIYILEHFDFTDEQMSRLRSFGEVKYFDKASQTQIDEAINNADAILIDWLDPDSILEKCRG